MRSIPARPSRLALALTSLTLIAALSGCHHPTKTCQPVGPVGPVVPSLGALSNFVVLAGTSVTASGASTMIGDVGVSPGATITIPVGQPTGGTSHANDAAAANAQLAATALYDALVALTPTADLTGQNLGSRTLTPGVYHFGVTAPMSGVCTLDGQGDPNAKFVFQVVTTLDVAGSASVALINGAQAKNVFWQVGSTATIGGVAVFKGTIIALTSITMGTASSLSGRAIGRTGTVTLNVTAVALP